MSYRDSLTISELSTSCATESFEPAAEGTPVLKSTQFTDAEVVKLLVIIRAHKPIGNEMWKQVEQE
jgi:hypothetical protein